MSVRLCSPATCSALPGRRSTEYSSTKERGAAGRNLHAVISDLARLNVSQSVIDGFHEARLLGNDFVHNGLEYAPDAEAVGA